jgi:hypothetical protein
MGLIVCGDVNKYAQCIVEYSNRTKTMDDMPEIGGGARYTN